MGGIGRGLMGGSKHQGNISMLLPEQQQALSQILQNAGGLGSSTFERFLGPMDEEQMQGVFQKAYVDPAMMAYNQQVVPGIQERFEGAGASSSSALTQALAQSASDLSTSLGSQYGQMYNQQNSNALNALQLLQPYVMGQTFSPHMQDRQGILGSMLGAVGNIGAGAVSNPSFFPKVLSSKKAKENIRSYEKGMDDLRKMDVKQYDYIKEVGGHKDRVGLIAEELPEEVTMEKDDYLHVDLYGVMGMMINAIKELESRIENLEVD